MPRTSVSQRLFASLCLSLSLAACQGPPPDDLETVDEPIINGAPFSNTSAQKSGVVMLSVKSGSSQKQLCTGTMLDSRWVLTAAQCFPPADDANGDGLVDGAKLSKYRVHFGNLVSGKPSSKSSAVDKIVRHPNGVFGVPPLSSVDVALVRLSASVTLSAPSGVYTNGRMPIYAGSMDHLRNARLTCYGYGYSTGTVDAPSGRGVLRAGSLTVVDVLPVYHTISPSPGGGPDADATGNLCGDQGGACFLDVLKPDGKLGTRFLTGVHSRGNCDPGPEASGPLSLDISAETFREWVLTTLYPKDTTRFWFDDSLLRNRPIPLPNNANHTYSFAPAGISAERCYYLRTTYDTQAGKDFVWINHQKVSGKGTLAGHACGVTPVSVKTDGSTQSQGVQIELSNPSCTFNCGEPPNGETCPGAEDGWRGCRGSGCHVCANLVKDYPRYFRNHPSCGLNTTCTPDIAPGRCSANCPAPTDADR